VQILTLTPAVAALSGRQQGRDPEAGLDPKRAAGDVLVILDHSGQLAVRSGPFHVSRLLSTAISIMASAACKAIS
jgi:hypothetical protein